MSDPSNLDVDMREFCARVLQEYEDVIEKIIQRPVPRAFIEQGPGVGALAIDGTLPAERA